MPPKCYVNKKNGINITYYQMPYLYICEYKRHITLHYSVQY